MNRSCWQCAVATVAVLAVGFALFAGVFWMIREPIVRMIEALFG